MEAWRHVDTETRRHGDTETRSHGGMEIWRHGAMETRRQRGGVKDLPQGSGLGGVERDKGL